MNMVFQKTVLIILSVLVLGVVSIGGIMYKERKDRLAKEESLRLADQENKKQLEAGARAQLEAMTRRSRH